MFVHQRGVLSSIAEQISTQQGNRCLYSAPPSQAPRVQQYRSLSSVRKEVHPRVPKPLTPNPFPACSRWRTGRHCFFCLSSFFKLRHQTCADRPGNRTARAHPLMCLFSACVNKTWLFARHVGVSPRDQHSHCLHTPDQAAL